MVIVVGSGIIGSWIAYLLAKAGFEVYVFEKSENAGDGISGRNSGVLHSGIYYDETSLKSKFCFRGYEVAIPFFEKNKIPFSICGKVITTGLSDTIEEEKDKQVEIEKLFANGNRLGIPDLELKSNPGYHWKHVLGNTALWIPKTGIVDVPTYLKVLWKLGEDSGVKTLKNKKVIRENGGVFALDLQSNVKEELVADYFINACGLYSDELASSDLMNHKYEIKPNKGEYFRLKKQLPYETLVYPLPLKTSTALGVHYTFHLGGDAYAGPNSNWAISKDDYKMNTPRNVYFESLRKITDFYKEEDLSEGYVGLRPRLFLNGEALKDFVIQKELNWIHLLGIESPGLTSSPAIAEEVVRMVG
ncbi:FAD-dependent oxidoreductase [Leptospira levettii]|uniref:NAD(P)/FAD-dependent oxidoreductase n=1 Tax=Leptospira levettii TaxID=2023178 RepID=UPI000C2AD08F|nr:FAD-dependent oxidoreductase [Leptospira levettii]PJZ36140.1 FAD-dependent oxidoreductase [Leptospira levettii]PJZ90126.1 FAD-dependent oxidoreductase [Leptospira levettii]PJZ99888.1 FAD-dependent oxidoreductase [Leptospira levettii]